MGNPQNWPRRRRVFLSGNHRFGSYVGSGDAHISVEPRNEIGTKKMSLERSHRNINRRMEIFYGHP
jgi:hypothetical protein